MLHKHFPCESFFEKVEKGHGRIERRKVSIYQLEMNVLDERWTNTNAKYFISIEREREESKTGKKSHEMSYYISNACQTAEHFFQTIRNHWTVEVGNNIKDTNFGGDQTKKFLF